MAKFTKTALKLIVKECLVEILQEGLMSPEISDTPAASLTRESRTRASRNRISERSERRIGLDKISVNKNLRENEDFEKNIANTANQMTDDPVLSSILMDTAKTTLQEQVSADRMGPGGMALPTAASGDSAARAMANSRPEDIFSEASSKWADLAFAPSIRLK